MRVRVEGEGWSDLHIEPVDAEYDVDARVCEHVRDELGVALRRLRLGEGEG